MTDRERLEYFYALSDRAASDWRSSPVVARIIRWLHPSLGNALDRMVLGTPEADVGNVRRTFELIPKAEEALAAAVGLTGHTRTDTVNRALQLYAFLVEHRAEGNELCMRNGNETASIEWDS